MTSLPSNTVFELIDVPLAELGLLWEVGDAAAAALWIPPALLDTYVNLDTATRPAVHEMTADAGLRWDAHRAQGSGGH